MKVPLLEACLPVYSFVDIDIIMPACTAVFFYTFYLLFCDVLSSLIRKLNKTTCVLDPFPTKLLMSHVSSILDIILCIVNLCFSSGVSFISKIIEKAIATQIHDHLKNNDIVDNCSLPIRHGTAVKLLC